MLARRDRLVKFGRTIVLTTRQNGFQSQLFCFNFLAYMRSPALGI